MNLRHRGMMQGTRSFQNCRQDHKISAHGTGWFIVIIRYDADKHLPSVLQAHYGHGLPHLIWRCDATGLNLRSFVIVVLG